MPIASLLVLLAAFCLIPAGATAQEFYRWVDEKGGVHFTDNFHSIPEKYRSKAEKRRAPAPSAAPAPVVEAQPGQSPTSPDSQRFVIPYSRRGNDIIVPVLINGTGPVELILDTGANVTMITWDQAKKLGLDPERGDPIRLLGVGATNVVSVIPIESLNLGGAEVRNLEITVHPAFGSGLLGMDFLSDFRTEINPAENQLTLVAQPGPHEGHSFQWWQLKFRFWYSEKRQLEQLFSTTQSPQAREFAAMALEFVNRKLNDLDIRASHAGVPREFRQ